MRETLSAKPPLGAADAADGRVAGSGRNGRGKGKLVWLSAIALAAFIISAGAALATAAPDRTAGWPAAKAQAWQQGLAGGDPSRAHPRPKPANPQDEAPPHRPDPTPPAGIDNAMHQGPFSALDFLVQNFWQGPVDSDWILVYAGAQRIPIGGTNEQGALRLYSETRDQNGDNRLQPVGTYLGPGGSGPITIVSVSGTVMALRTDTGAALAFDLRRHEYH